MKTFTFTVEVDANTEDEARRVMSERIGFEEDYGFPYRIDWKWSDLTRKGKTPPPEDNVSAYGYWEWCQQRGKSPANLENAAEYCGGWAEASDAKGIYEWIKQLPMSDIMRETHGQHGNGIDNG